MKFKIEIGPKAALTLKTLSRYKDWAGIGNKLGTSLLYKPVGEKICGHTLLYIQFS